MSASTSPHRSPKAPAIVLGAALVIGGVAAVVFIFATMESQDPGLRSIAIALGLGPAAFLSGLAQLAVLIGGRMLFLAWRGRK